MNGNGWVVYPDGLTIPYDEWSANRFADEDTPQAWSTVAEPYPDTGMVPVTPEPHHHDWAHVLKVAAGIGAAMCLVLAGLGVLKNPPWHPDAAPAPVHTIPTPTPVNNTVDSPDPPPLVMPTVMAAHQTQDGDYLQRVGPRAGFTLVDPAQDIKYGHWVCRYMAATGQGAATAAFIAKSQNPFDVHPLSSWQLEADAAHAVYCPELA